MEIFFLWLVLAIIPAIIASSKGRSGFAWFLYGALIWPIALVHAIVIRPNLETVERRALEGGDVVKCHYCAELVRSEARICKHCGRDPRGEPAAGEPAPVETPARPKGPTGKPGDQYWSKLFEGLD